MLTTPNEEVFGCTAYLPGELVALSRPTDFSYEGCAKSLVQQKGACPAHPPCDQRISDAVASHNSTHGFVRIAGFPSSLPPLGVIPFLLLKSRS